MYVGIYICVCLYVSVCVFMCLYVSICVYMCLCPMFLYVLVNVFMYACR